MLYMTEGIPLGFTATAIATQMRRQGMGPVAIGAFVGSLYLPWAFKWVMGPFVDAFASDRFGRRRLWIVATQIGMMATLIFAMPIDYVAQIGLFTAVIFLHNAFAATQDVAIDALAVNVLPEHERGVANGFMFAGASIGQAVGGSGVLFLTAVMPFGSTYIFVAGTILLVTLVHRAAAARAAGPAATAFGQEPDRRGRRRPRAVRARGVASLHGIAARACRRHRRRCCRSARTRCRSRCSRTSRSSWASTTTRSRD